MYVHLVTPVPRHYISYARNDRHMYVCELRDLPALLCRLHLIKGTLSSSSVLVCVSATQQDDGAQANLLSISTSVRLPFIQPPAMYNNSLAENDNQFEI